jgi:uncharacterized protein YjiS (DUF1127 family)
MSSFSRKLATRGAVCGLALAASGNLLVPVTVPVPEPAGLVLFGSALAGLALARRRKARAGQAAFAALEPRLLADIGLSRSDALAIAQGIGIDRLKPS